MLKNVASWHLQLLLHLLTASLRPAHLCLPQCLDTGSWELTDVPPQRQQQRQVLRPPGRHSHIAGAYEHQGVILFGGAGLRGPLNDVWLFHCPTASWRCLSEELAEDESPAAREMAAGTMISDAGLLVHQAGYRCSGAGVVNMFPHTAHVESMAVFDLDV